MENFTEFTGVPLEEQESIIQSFTNYIKNFLIIIGICTTAASFSIVLISHQLFTNVSKTYREAHGYDSEEEEEGEEQEGPFEDRYLDKYYNLGDRDIDDKELIAFKDDYDSVETPRGIVKLAYDMEKASFIYYSNTKDIPVIMLTAKNMGDDFEKALDKKADWYIAKPYDNSHLIYRVKYLLQKGKEKK